MLVTRIKKQSGKITQTEIDKINQLLSFCGDGDYIITIKHSESKRSIQQNKLFWLLINCLGDYFGYSSDEMHDLICKKFLSYSIESVDKNGEIKECQVNKTTKNLKTKEFSELIDKMYELGRQFNIDMPRPEEQRFELFEEAFSQKH